MAGPDPLLQRLDELATRVLGPLVLGGRLSPVRPFGAKLALSIGRGRALSDTDLRSRLDVARVRVARLVAPLDTVADLSAADWALVAGLNDLLQATNHELTGPLTRGRHHKLLDSVRALCERVPAPRTVGAALSRHATFARALECVRTDTQVSWWTGRASFRGEAPPRRLLQWPSVRNVQVDARRVGLAEMAEGAGALDEDEFADALTLWLTRSPLTDLASAARRSPPFAWSASTLAVIASTPGRTLAFRLLSRQGREQALGALERAGREIPARFAEARALAAGFAAEVAAGLSGGAGRREATPQGGAGRVAG